jgi:hypothetical protein
MADMNVYIYPNNTNEDTLASDAESALTIALDEVVSDSIWDENITYNVDIRYPYPNVPDDNRDIFRGAFALWAVPNVSERGVHLGISGNFDGGWADSGSGLALNAWFGETTAVAGEVLNPLSRQPRDSFKNISIQEAFHPFIDKYISEVGDLLGSDENVHSLGYLDIDNNVSPMATSYISEGYATDGTCRGGDSVMDGYTTSPSGCTIEAMYHTEKNYRL